MAQPWKLTDLLSGAGRTQEMPPAEKVAQLPVSLDKLHKSISELQGRLVQEQCEEARIEQARQQFHANDNIAAFIRPGELEALLEEVTVKMQAVLESLVIDTASDHNTQDTARRIAKMYLNEVFRGRYVAPPPVTPSSIARACTY